MSKVFTINEVAEYLKVHPSTIRKLINCDVLKKSDHWFYIGKQIRVKEEALKAIMCDSTN